MRRPRPRGDLPPYVRAAVVLGLAVGVFGVSFGILAVTSGLTAAQAVVMSLAVFTGASQFAAVGTVASGGSLVAAVASALLLAARNAAYGLALAPIVRHRMPVGLVAAHLVLDETTALATAQEGADRRRAFWATGVSVFVCWNAGTAVGVLAGSEIADPAALGLDAAFPAGFVALIAPHLRRRAGRVAAALGGTIAVVLLPVTPAGLPIVAAAAAAPIAAFATRRAGP